MDASRCPKRRWYILRICQSNLPWGKNTTVQDVWRDGSESIRDDLERRGNNGYKRNFI